MPGPDPLRPEAPAGDAALAWEALGWALDAVEATLAWGAAAPDPESAGAPAVPARPPADLDPDAYRRWMSAHPDTGAAGRAGAPYRARLARALLRLALPGSRRATSRDGGTDELPIVSILLPAYRPRLGDLEACIASVEAQTWPGWELCICDDGSSSASLSAFLAAAHRRDPRVKLARRTNAGISAATNVAAGLATGDLVALLDHDDELAPHAIESVARAFAADPELDVAYSDEDKLDKAGNRVEPYFKPDFSPDLLLATNYVCHLLVMRRSIFAELGGMRSEFDGSQDWDLTLRATEIARRVLHVPDVLYHWRKAPGSAAAEAHAKPWAIDAGRRAVEDALARRAQRSGMPESGSVEPGRIPGHWSVRHPTRTPARVSVVIPFRDEPALLRTCLDSLRSDPGVDGAEWVLADNASTDPETRALLDRLAGDRSVTVLDVPGAFNWSAINNAAARAAGGDVLVFCNNDLEAASDGWLERLTAHALRREVGAVGARLLYPDGRVQHAGVVVGLNGFADHAFRDLPGCEQGYFGLAVSTRNVSAVTGACMATRREVFEKVGGFDEELAVAFNDIDYCLRLAEEGFRIVYEPAVEMVHHESRTRGRADDTPEAERFAVRWRGLLRDGDPFYNPNLSRHHPWYGLER